MNWIVMKQLLILGIAFFLVSCQHKASKERAMEYWDNNQFELALAEINNAIELCPDSSSFYFLRMKIYEVMSKYDEELNDLSKIIQLNQNEREVMIAYYQRAIVKSNLGLFREALVDIDYFISQQETSSTDLPSAYINKASILYQLNDTAEAKSFYLMALTNATNDVKVSVYLGLSNLTDNPKDALGLLEKALQLDENNASVLASRATIYLEQGDIEKAMSDSRKSFYLDPYNAPNNFNLGQIYAHYLNEPDSAMKYFERTIKLEPYSAQSASAYINLAIMENNGGNSKKAYQYAEKAVGLMPNNDGFQYNLAHILSDMGKNREALDAISKAIEINPQEVEYYNLKGAILIEMLRSEDAISVFRKCIEIDPEFGEAYYNLGYIYEQKNDHNMSIAFYNKAVLLDFDLQSTLVNLALQEIEIEKISDAYSHLVRAYKLGRKDIKPLIDKYRSIANPK